MEEIDKNPFEETQSRRPQDSVFDHNFVALLFVALVLTVLVLCRCAPPRKVGPTPPVTTKPGPIRPPEIIPDFQGRPVAGAMPNQYLVRLTWNLPGPLTLYRQDKSGTLKKLAALEPNAARFDDVSVVPGESYRYFLANGLEDTPELKTSTVVAVPKDFVLGQDEIRDGVVSAERLFVSANAPFRTDGRDLSIDAQEIISDSGVIETFAPDAKAPVGQNGRGGGVIKITAKRGTGKLQILARGESGGDGVDGITGSPGGAGGPGLPGDWGITPAAYRAFSRNWLDAWERGARLHPDSNPWEWHAGSIYLFGCAKPPENGAVGGKGSPGTDGGMGGDGGPSAEVSVVISEKSPLTIDVVSEPGRPGIGGRAGKGGPGGPGGPPGAIDLGHRCGPASQGVSGPFGLDGRQGIPGSSGRAASVCVKMASQTLLGCDLDQGVK